jgi:formate dehydrogenase beta subunit
MGIPGEGSPGVIDGLAFLRQVNEGKAPAIGRKVIVVGGGNTATDASRASIRLGAKVVQLYRRTRAEMPAGSEEIVEALKEGVRIEYLAAPVRIEKGRVTCTRMRLDKPDATGRRAPVPVSGSEFGLPFDTLIMAIGQSADAGSLHLEEEKNGVVRMDKGNLATPLRGVFAGGDAVSGPSTIIEAIAQGRLACVSIDRFLGGTGNLPEALSEDSVSEPPETAPRGTARPVTRTISLKRRSGTFDPVELSYTKKAAMAEAVRCLSCDLCDFEVSINALICKDCGYCGEVCSLGIFEQSTEFNPSGYKPAIAVNTDRCIGCLRCLYICPDFAITIQARKSGG